MQPLWKFLTDHKDSLEVIVKLLGFLVGGSSLIGLIQWLLQRAWIKRRRSEIQVFEIINDIDSLLPKVYGSEQNDSPLADHKFTYQARDHSCNIKLELRQILNKRRHLLIFAPTGYGKTREACALAQDLMVEGYRVIRIKPGWLDVPKDLPAELSSQRTRIVILLDDLNGLFRIGDYVQSPKYESLLLTGQSSYSERLTKVLDTFESIFGSDEIRVIATARSEVEEKKVLKYNINHSLWRRFGEPYQLERPSAQALISFLETAATRCGLLVEPADVEAIIGTNQGAYRNIVQNLRRLKEEYIIVSKENYIPTLNGSWKEYYEILVDERFEIKFIYDAIDVLQQARISLYVPIVLKLALFLWGGDRIQQFGRRRRLAKGMDYLMKEKKILPHSGEILIPYDGQINERGAFINWAPFHSGVTYLALIFSDIYGSALLNSLSNLRILLIEHNQESEAEKIRMQILKLLSVSARGEGRIRV